MLGTPTDPALLAALERAAKHVMTPAEQHAQRRSWVIGQMGLSRPDLPRAEIEALVDAVLGPAPAPPKVQTYSDWLREIADRIDCVAAHIEGDDEAGVYLTQEEWHAVTASLRHDIRLVQVTSERDAAIARAERAEIHNGAQSLAQAFATRVHADQKDKAGLPYTGHLVRVAARAYAHAIARGLGPEIASRCVQVGWLHDTVEDTETTLLELTAEGFDLRVVGAVERLTRPNNTPYLDWIRAIIASGDTVAMIVKLADNEDNADPARAAVYPISTRLLDRYEQSAALLREALS